MSDVIDFGREKSKREDQPDADCVRRDDFGRPMFLFLCGYEVDGGQWGLEVWAYSEEEAQKRVAAMRESLVLQGQVYSVRAP